MIKMCAKLAIAALTVAGCTNEGSTFTLYRNSALDASMRIHVASFDTGEGEDYNNENCEAARGLFQDQNGVSVRYWCEKGRFRS